jgi:hypothetical protein
MEPVMSHEQERREVFTLKPTLWGFSVDLKELWRRMRNRSTPATANKETVSPKEFNQAPSVVASATPSPYIEYLKQEYGEAQVEDAPSAAEQTCTS